MSFRVKLHPLAQEDLDVILDWLSKRSPEAAMTWYSRWEDVLQELGADADKCSLAPESEGCKREVRQVIFKTRRGREYRVLFTFDDQAAVVILHVRGPGQDLLDPEELREP